VSGNQEGAVHGGGHKSRLRRIAARSGVDIAVAVAALAVGIGVFQLAKDDSGGQRAPTPNDPDAFEVAGGDAGSSPSPTEVPARGGGAPSGREAVETWLQAEIAGDLETSFSLLSDADRAVYASVAGYEANHADLPVITGFRVDEATDGDGRAEVRTVTDFEPTLDEVVGLVPAQAEATWVAVYEGSAWYVALAESTLMRVPLPEEDANDAVQDWVSARVACDLGADFEGGLVGSSALAQELCGADDDIELGDVGPLDPLDGAAFVSAFGEDASEWARVIPVNEPVEMQAVVAPVGDTWVVIGVLPP
jgi:hypothetical protein